MEDAYYYGIMKECKNCAWRNKSWITLSRCNYYPTYATETAMGECKLSKWQPNQKLYDIMSAKDK